VQQYGQFFTTIRAIARLGVRKKRLSDPDGLLQPAIYIGRHLDSFGPVQTMIHFPIPVRIWAIYTLADPQSATEHYREYTYHKRYGWPMFLARPAAWVAGHMVGNLLQSSGAIPVYRGHREVMRTMDNTVECLAAGDNILLFPDIDYTSESGTAGPIYTGFVHLAKMAYERNNGQIVPFIPIYVSKHHPVMEIGQPIYYNPEASFRAERTRIAGEITNQLTELAARVGEKE
jgi:hypothetical protein